MVQVLTSAQRALAERANKEKSDLESLRTKEGGARLSPLLPAAEELPSETSLPSEYTTQDIDAPTGISPAEGTSLISSDLEAKDREAGTMSESLKKAIADKVGIFVESEDDTGGGIQIGTREARQATEKKFSEELATQQMRATRGSTKLYDITQENAFEIDDDKLTPKEQYQEALGSPMQSGDEVVSNVLSEGEMLTDEITRQMLPTLTADPVSNPLAGKIQNLIGQTGLVDTQARKVVPRVGNAFAITVLETLQNMQNKADDMSSAGDTEIDFNNPNAIRERLAKSLFNKVLENPNVGYDPSIRTDYGGAGDLIDPEVLSAVDTVLYNVMDTMGYLSIKDLNENDSSTVIVEEEITPSKKGQAFLDNNRQILADIFPDQRVNVAYVPPIVENAPGRERELGDKAKPISRRNKASKNTVFEDSVKLTLSSMPMRIDKDGFNYVNIMVAGTVTINPETGLVDLIDRHEGNHFFSKSPWAKTLGLHEAKWLEAREKALKKYGEEGQAEATEQANKVMRSKARAILRMVDDATINLDKVFYNKWMHASSVGRYFVRNMVLNPQNDKTVRGMITSAEKLIVNLKNPLKGRDKDTFDDWKYIIGKNLLDPDKANDYNPTNNLRTEDMQWSAIMRETNQIINDPSSTVYKQWEKMGNDLKAALETKDPAVLAKVVEARHTEAFKKSGEWQYKLQSYIDFANYAKAKRDGVSFEMRATTQHDGKQNGIAIQAMQNADPALSRLIGMLYSPDKDSVIPQGDIRDKFIKGFLPKENNPDTQLDFIFKAGSPKNAFWSDVFSTINKLPTEQRADLIKVLTKTPLMETSYGMPKQFHMETALDFIDGEGGNVLKKVLLRHTETADGYLREDIASDLNEIIGRGLEETLDLKKQKLYKDAGMLWAMLGVTPEMVGPLGTNIYMGTNEHFKTGKTITVPGVNGEDNIIELTESRSTGSSGKRTRNRVYDRELKQYKITDRSRFGKLVSNQLPVLTVQQIDAAIMANTIFFVNKQKEGRFKPAKFVIPVHDAIITNAGSVSAYHREINNQFKKVNMEYSISQAVNNGLKKALANMKKKVDRNPNQMVELSYDSRYRAVHDLLVGIEDRANRKVELGGGSQREYLSSAEQGLLRLARANGRWTRDGGEIPLTTLYQIIKDYELGKNIFEDLSIRHNQAESRKSKLYAALLKLRGYQYN